MNEKVVHEIRVRPVQRFGVTRYQKVDDGTSSLTTVGEFAEPMANEIANALKAQHPDARLIFSDGDVVEAERRIFAIVKRGFEPETLAYYAESRQDAQCIASKLSLKHGEEFRIFDGLASTTQSRAAPAFGADHPAYVSRYLIGDRVMRRAVDIRQTGPGLTGTLHHYEAEIAEVCGVHFYPGKVCYDVTFPSGRHAETVDSVELLDLSEQPQTR